MGYVMWMSETVYAYADLAGVRKIADDGDLNARGTWTASGTYVSSTRDVATYGSAKYIAIADSISKNPAAETDYWSILSVISAGTTPSLAEQAYALASEKLDLSGGTLTGNLVVPNLVYGYSGSISSGGTLLVDMGYRAFLDVPVTENTHVVPFNITPCNGATLILRHDSTPRVLTLSAGVRTVGSAPGTLAAGKISTLELRACGSNIGDVVGTFLAEP